jgi:hypothetical protein
MRFLDSDIDGAGDDRLGVMAGGSYGLWRFHPVGAPDRGVQIDVQGAFSGQFDRTSSQDNVGWDGYYGIQVAWVRGRGPDLRFAAFHDSGHLGDEYIESTGRERVDYTRQDLLVGASWKFRRHWRVYGDVAYGADVRNDFQDRWRGQYGLEYESDVLFGDGWGWYAAMDVGHFEENDWNADVTFQSGVQLRTDGIARTYRVGVEYYDGRSLMGEFFLQDERSVSIGFWLDL